MIPSKITTIAAERLGERNIRGTIGHRGKVQSAVRVVTTRQDFQQLKIGEIVVIDTLGPDNVKYLQGIAGIITNAGGILSHAALVAREFRIPCVVGTKYATQLLRTGDIVSLDANTGTVKVIHKA